MWLGKVDEECPLECNGNGVCEGVECICKMGFIDRDCGTPSTILNLDQKTIFQKETLETGEIEKVFFSFFVLRKSEEDGDSFEVKST